MSDSKDERSKLVPKILRNRHTYTLDGYEIVFERVNRYGERAASRTVTELSLTDLEVLADKLNWYLDEGRYQE